jgi:hypothetical protein
MLPGGRLSDLLGGVIFVTALSLLVSNYVSIAAG